MERMYPQMSFTKRVKAVVLEDESKEAESGKDGQKTEVTFEDGSEDESEDLENDDQRAFEGGLEGLEKDGQNNPFIAIDWHAWLERILEVSKKAT